MSMFNIKTNLILGAIILLAFLDKHFTEAEYPFPYLDHSKPIVSILGQHEVKSGDTIKSETVLETLEFSTKNLNIKITDGETQKSANFDNINKWYFMYSPYSCTPIDVSQHRWDGPDSFPYGLALLWNEVRDEKFTQEDENNDAKWKFIIDEYKIKLVFIAKDMRGASKPTIDLVEVYSEDGKTLIKTIRILHISYLSSSDLLRIPLGYGCRTGLRLTSNVEAPSMIHAEFEVSATAFTYDKSNTPIPSARKSDLASIEILKDDEQRIQMIRRRNSTHDIKSIIDQSRSLAYRLDERRGTCEISHFCSDSNDPIDDQYHRVCMRSERTLSFSNDLKLPLEPNMIKKLIETPDGYVSIYNITLDDQRSYQFYETEWDANNLWPGKPAIVTRKYDEYPNLLSVTLRVLSPEKDRIEALYHMNKLNFRLDKNINSYDNIEWAKHFDVSDQCYLENDNAIQNKDYAWFKFTYYLESSIIMGIMRRHLEFKTFIYDQLMEQFKLYGLTMMRIPKVELIPNLPNSELVIRVLILDNPSPLEAYEQSNRICIDKSKDSKAIEDTARDLRHCSDICREHHCQVFSYNYKSLSCIITTSERTNYISQNDYISYFNEGSIDYGANLAKIKSILEHRAILKYALDTGIPPRPDILKRPPDTSELSLEEYKDLAENYWKSVMEYLEKFGSESKLMVFREITDTSYENHLFPGNLLIEEDPFSEFNIGYTNEEGQAERLSFHHGLSGYTYRWNPNGRSGQYSRISQDQCELACIDSKCSSYSYCSRPTQELCIITDIYEINQVIENQTLIEKRSDCSLMQRDLIYKFNKFENVIRSNNPKQTVALNPNECAHKCFEDDECLAFDYCNVNGVNECLLLATRDIYTGNNDGIDWQRKSEHPTGCDHYSRSYLADFSSRFKYKQIKSDKLERITEYKIEGQTSDQCADKCIKDTNCDTFQICFPGGIAPIDEEDHQRCWFIDYDRIHEKIEDTDYETGVNCHVYNLLPEVKRTRSRTVFPDASEIDDGKNKSGLTILGGLGLYLGVTLLMATLGCGFILLRHNNERFRQGIERAQIFLRLRRF